LEWEDEEDEDDYSDFDDEDDDSDDEPPVPRRRAPKSSDNVDPQDCKQQ
jgi:nucleosome assembly protein 1-like 1